ncbi:hypothetical protein [Microvirga arabica]|uniref:hypothetical protein n=1 Tax=Microvirga arabica TaxID=1128671 RepID=UPI00193ABFCF|nr:hypothetical protein [Microvirga arabica]MBM1169650.1 hypothetical protein [Microvirga arabica]
MAQEGRKLDEPPTCTRTIIASLYFIGLAAGGVVLNDWIEGRLVPSEGAMLILVFACIAGTIRLIR